MSPASDPDRVLVDDRLDAAHRQVVTLRHRVRLLEIRLELVEAAMTSRERGWVPGLLRFLLRRR